MSDAIVQRVRTRMFVRECIEDVFGQETNDAEVERIAERVEKAMGLPALDAAQNAVRVARRATGEDK